jgi:hypothetical protein
LVPVPPPPVVDWAHKHLALLGRRLGSSDQTFAQWRFVGWCLTAVMAKFI